MVEVTVYKSPGCPRCEVLFEWLRKMDVEFVTKDASDTDVQAELILQNVFDMDTPILELEGRFYLAGQLFEEEELRTSFLEKLLSGKQT